MAKKKSPVELVQVQTNVQEIIETVVQEITETVVQENQDALQEFGPDIIVKKVRNAPKTTKTGVGARIIELILEGELSSKEIVAKVCDENPERKTTYSCVDWYKSKIKNGSIVVNQEEAQEA